MILVKPSANIEFMLPGDEILARLERAGRTCYKSEKAHDKQVEDLLADPKFLPHLRIVIGDTRKEAAHKQVTQAFIKMLLKRGHESVFEHASATVRFTVNRGVTHELVRHRLASFSQESTRYCDYSSDSKFDGHCQFIIPNWLTLEPDIYSMKRDEDGKGVWAYRNGELIDAGDAHVWLWAMHTAEQQYQALRKAGWRPEQARDVLPNATKAEIVVTANLRQWRLMFSQRTAIVAHPQMREVMVPLLQAFRAQCPIIFDDAYLPEEKGPDPIAILRHLWEDVTDMARIKGFSSVLELAAHLKNEHGPQILKLLRV